MKYASVVALCYLLYAFTTVQTNGVKERNCPSARKIKPCVCGMYQKVASLTCKSIHNVETLRNVFRNSGRHVFYRVLISDSSLAYLPQEMFKWTDIGKLYLRDTTMIQFVDESPPIANSVHRIDMLNIEMQRGISWEHFKTFTNLEELQIVNVHVNILGKAFQQYVNKNLQTLFLRETGTRRIMPGTLVPFRNLVILSFVKCQLTKLTRDIFPNPFMVMILMLSENHISEISGDLFTNMPQLAQLWLDGNHITTLPETAFAKTTDISNLKLEGNPLECDCRLQWILRIRNRHGICTEPVEGKPLISLTENDFNC